MLGSVSFIDSYCLPCTVIVIDGRKDTSKTGKYVDQPHCVLLQQTAHHDLLSSNPSSLLLLTTKRTPPPPLFLSENSDRQVDMYNCCTMHWMLSENLVGLHSTSVDVPRDWDMPDALRRSSQFRFLFPGLASTLQCSYPSTCLVFCYDV